MKYQVYGYDEDGRLVHAGPRTFPELTAKAVRQDQENWEEWAKTVAAKWPDCPTAQSIGRTVRVTVEPITGGQVRQFVVGKWAKVIGRTCAELPTLGG